MISPSAQEELQRKIDAVIERARDNPELQEQVNEALAAAQRKNDAAVASGVASSGLVGAQYQELSIRGLIT